MSASIGLDSHANHRYEGGYRRDAVHTPGRRSPVLHATLLARTHELNRDYVELLLAEPGSPRLLDTAHALPQKVCDALACVAPAWRAQIAACPFALYSLRFDDQQFWNAALDDFGAELPFGHVPESLERRYGAGSAKPLSSTFCELALFFAWHTAMTNPVAARVLFAMPDLLAERLPRVPLWQMRRIALDYPGLLVPRWPNNPGFWPDLVTFAAACDTHRLETARLLGSQLIAAELEPTIAPDGKVMRPRVRPVKVRHE
jgi:hypothetical protein